MSSSKLNKFNFNYRDALSMSMGKFFFKHAKLDALQNLERESVNLGTPKKSFEKARRNAEREEEMKERGHASREGPAGTRAQL